MHRVLLCSTAVPWPNRPLLGIFHVHQARAVRALGGEVELFSPSIRVPRWLGRAVPRLRDHSERPERYVVDGITVRAPRTPFVFPPAVRRHAAHACPRAVLRLADRLLGPALDAAVAEFRPDVLLAHGILPWGDAVAHAAARAGIEHAFIEHSAGDLERLVPGTAIGEAYRDAARCARAVFVVGPQMQDHATHVLGWPNVVLLPNGALRPATAPPPRPATLAGRRVVLAPANYYRRKGFEELVAAFEAVASAHPDVDLHLVTAAPATLRSRIAAAAHADRIVVHPPMEPEALLGWMGWADLLALPSWSEAFGLVYVEALAQRTPVLCTTDSGFCRFANRWQEAGHDVPALVVPPRDVGALANALEVAFTDRERVARTARSGAAMVDTWFSWERNARTLLDHLAAPPVPRARVVTTGPTSTTSSSVTTAAAPTAAARPAHAAATPPAARA